jgi:ketosteroid isomerase-like protein
MNISTLDATTPRRVLESIVAGVNMGDLEGLMPLYEDEAAFAVRSGILAHGPVGIRESLTGFISMNGRLDIDVAGLRVLEVDGLALVIGDWTFEGTGPNGESVRFRERSADVMRRQADGTWRFVIDNPWGTADS